MQVPPVDEADIFEKLFQENVTGRKGTRLPGKGTLEEIAAMSRRGVVRDLELGEPTLLAVARLVTDCLKATFDMTSPVVDVHLEVPSVKKKMNAPGSKEGFVQGMASNAEKPMTVRDSHLRIRTVCTVFVDSRAWPCVGCSLDGGWW